MNTKFYKKISELKKETGKLSKDSSNPFFKSKYFDINQLLEHLEPIAESKGLLILQPIIDSSVVSQIIDIETGDKIESSISLSTITDPQKKGSEITYYRRYSLTSLLGLQAEDDDANKASGKVTEKPAEAPKVTDWLNEAKFNEAKNDIEKAKKALIFYDGKTNRDGKIYGMKKEYRAELLKLK